MGGFAEFGDVKTGVTVGIDSGIGVTIGATVVVGVTVSVAVRIGVTIGTTVGIGVTVGIDVGVSPRVDKVGCSGMLICNWFWGSIGDDAGCSEDPVCVDVPSWATMFPVDLDESVSVGALD